MVWPFPVAHGKRIGLWEDSTSTVATQHIAMRQCQEAKGTQSLEWLEKLWLRWVQVDITKKTEMICETRTNRSFSRPEADTSSPDTNQYRDLELWVQPQRSVEKPKCAIVGPPPIHIGPTIASLNSHPPQDGRRSESKSHENLLVTFP